jgi:hypothetical protein
MILQGGKGVQFAGVIVVAENKGKEMGRKEEEPGRVSILKVRGSH